MGLVWRPGGRGFWWGVVGGGRGRTRVRARTLSFIYKQTMLLAILDYSVGTAEARKVTVLAGFEHHRHLVTVRDVTDGAQPDKRKCGNLGNTKIRQLDCTWWWHLRSISMTW